MTEKPTYEELEQKVKDLENTKNDRKFETAEKLVFLIYALIESHKQYIQGGDRHRVFEGLLSAILKYTNSEFGFIGEVYYEADGTPYQLSRAISNISWNEHTRKYYDENWRDGIRFESNDTLTGIALNSGEVVISNDTANDPRSKRVPEGHPVISTFLGVPIYHEDRLIGSFGLANRPGGYDDQLVCELQPFVSGCSVIISALKSDIECEQAEQALQESEERYREHFLQFPVPIFVWNYQGDKFVLTSYNDAAERITDGKAKKFLGISAEQLYGEENSSHIYKTILDCYRAKRAIQKEFKYRLKSTEQEKWIKGTWVFIKPDTIMLHTEDITDRKRAEEALIQSERKWRNILVNTPQIGISLDPQAKIVFANEQFLKLTGWEEHEIIGKDWFDMFIPANVKERIKEIFLYTMSHKDTLEFSNFENEILTKSGEILNVAWSNLVTKDIHNEIVDLTCLGIDLTERRKAENEIRAQKHLFETMFNTITDGVVISNTQREILLANKGMETTFGYTPEDLIGKTTKLLYTSQNEFKKTGTTVFDT